MIYLENRRKKIVILIIVALIILLASYFFYFKNKLNQNTPPDDNEWNTSIDNEIPSDFDLLYGLNEVPPLEKLFVNATFIKQVTVNRVPYLHGFSSDGHYAVFINYTDQDGEAFIIQVYDTFTTELVYSTYIPNSENLLESKELAVAQQTINEGFAIEVMPDKLKFENQMEYEVIDAIFTFEFEVDKEVNSSYLKVAKKDSKERWFIFANSNLKYKKSDVQMFTYPDNTNFVTFVVNNSSFYDQNYTPIFINIDELTYENSEKGRVEEADNWLYGNFEFIYNQWNANEHHGFIAISTDNKSIENPTYSDFVEQWIYLDSTGKMRWYGNAKGIFDLEANAVHQLDRTFYYRVRIMEGININKLQALTVDQYDFKTNKLVRTFEFAWNNEKGSLEGIQLLED